MLVLSRGPEEGIMIGGDVEVRVLDVRGDRVRLGIVAPAAVAIHRKEIFLSIQRENRAAAASEAAGLEGAVRLLGRETVAAEAAGAHGKSVQKRGKVEASRRRAAAGMEKD